MFAGLIKKIKLRKMGEINYARSQGVTVGKNCRFISYPDFGSEPYLISIGDHVNICSDVCFITHDGATWVFREKPEYKNVIKYGPIIIGNNCFIGKGTTILPGVTIGDNCVVGACSLVTKDVEPGIVVGGVPAHKISEVSTFEKKCLDDTPNYDIDRYKKNKIEVLKEIYMNNRTK